MPQVSKNINYLFTLLYFGLISLLREVFETAFLSRQRHHLSDHKLINIYETPSVESYLGRGLIMGISNVRYKRSTLYWFDYWHGNK